jgi:hypothetical protein
MYKLIILIESTADSSFNDNWPRFLHTVEKIPGLRREATCRVSQVLVGDLQCALIHELYFDTSAALQFGLSSAPGKEAGRLLQEMTGGRVRLLLADHNEDDLENIRKFRKPEQDAKSQTGRA